MNEQHTNENTNQIQKEENITKRFWKQPINVKLTLLFDFLLVVATSTYAYVAYHQWFTMSEQLTTFKRQVDIMKQQTEVMSKQAEITSKQTEIMNKQAEIMSKQMTISVRPWVGVKSLGLKNTINSGEPPIATINT